MLLAPYIRGMKPSVLRLFLLVMVMAIAVTIDAFAGGESTVTNQIQGAVQDAGQYTSTQSTAGTTNGELGAKLATGLYCDGKHLIQGSLGMAIGLLMVFGGLWSMVRGGKIISGIIMIAFGAILTALPSMIEATLQGLGNLLSQSGMTQGTTFDPPECSRTEVQKIDDAYEAGACTSTADCAGG